MSTDAIVFLATLPICLWIAWSDLALMRIPNLAVLALVAVFLVFGPVSLGWNATLWRVGVQAFPVLFLGVLLFAVGAVGAGDAKLAAAMALFVGPGDGLRVLVLASAALLVALVAHRAARAVPAVRGLAPDWTSWTSHAFPMGFPLAGTLILYLALALVHAGAGAPDLESVEAPGLAPIRLPQ
jgi:prepilin peptidase CpaA